MRKSAGFALGALWVILLGACSHQRSNIVLKEHPLQHYVLGRYQIKVPSSFVLDYWSARLLRVSVEAMDVPVADSPEAAFKAVVAARTQWLKYDEEPAPRRSPEWSPGDRANKFGTSEVVAEVVEKAIGPNSIFLEATKTIDEEALQIKHEVYFLHPELPARIYVAKLEQLIATSNPAFISLAESQKIDAARLADFWTVVHSFEPLLQTTHPAPVNHEWFYLPGAVLKLPYPKERFAESDTQDYAIASFVDKSRKMKLFFEANFPRLKDGEGILSGLVLHIQAMVTSLQIERSGNRYVDGAKGEEIIALDPDADQIHFGLKATPSKASEEYRPALNIEAEAPLTQKNAAIEIWDAVVDTLFALTRSTQP